MYVRSLIVAAWLATVAFIKYVYSTNKKKIAPKFTHQMRSKTALDIMEDSNTCIYEYVPFTMAAPEYNGE